MAKLGLITIHGMGDTKPDFSDELKGILQKGLGSKWNEIHLEPIYYQGIFQDNEERVWDNMQSQPPKKLRWNELRKFVLYGFADAASLEHKNDEDNSVYKQTQKVIVEHLRNLRQELEHEDSPVIVVAQSLGCQVISNYIWDAQTGKGVWEPGTNDYIDPKSDEIDFLRLKTMKFLLTTGCNIPIFVAGFDKIVPFDKSKMHSNFAWKNYYDRDDVLGWPLQPLSDEYNQLVEDIEIDSGNFGTGMTPLSHTKYWSDRDFTKPLMDMIQSLL